MRLNPIICDTQTSHALQSEQLTHLYRRISAIPSYPIRYDGKEFSEFKGAEPCEKSDKHWWERLDKDGEPTEDYTDFDCPFGAVNDLLWVQEPWLKIDDTLLFSADFLTTKTIEKNNLRQLAMNVGWQDAQSLSLENARLLLKITELKVIEVNCIWLWFLQVVSI